VAIYSHCLLRILVLSLIGFTSASTPVVADDFLCDLALLNPQDRNLHLAKTIENYVDQIKIGYHLPFAFTSGYFTRRIEPYLAKPEYTPDSTGHLFRGIYVQTSELSEILVKGMPLSRVQWGAGAGKQIYFSTSEREAISYIFHNSKNDSEGVGLVVEILPVPDLKLLGDAALNSTRTIFYVGRDIPASQIHRIYLFGEHGLESIESILKKIHSGKMKPSSSWTNFFNSQ